MLRRNSSIKLLKNRSLIIVGPASIELISGNASILFSPIRIGETIVIERYRQISVYAEEESIVKISNGLAQVRQVEGTTIHASWNNLVSDIKEVSAGKIVIIGETDAGKSTLSTYIINNLLKYYSKIFAIDSDIGQSDIGPPATIGMGTTRMPIKALHEIKPKHIFFIGMTSPLSSENKILYGLKKMLSIINENNIPVVVNTDGWLDGSEALQFKLDFLNSISPEIVICLGNKAERITNYINYPVIKLQLSPHIYKRNIYQRRCLRELKFYRFLKNGKVNEYSINTTIMKGTIMKAKTDLDNLLVGLLDEHEWLINIGIVTGFHIDRKKVYIYSRIVKPVSMVDGGFIKIDKSGKEIEFKKSF